MTEEVESNIVLKSPPSGVLRRMLDNRANRIIDGFESFVEKGESFLSVGDGDGCVAERTIHRCGLVPQGLDVKVDIKYQRSTEVPLDYYDGTKMPYADNSFDVVAAIFVLHHCNEADKVLAEMARVARKKVIIIEDVYKTFFGKWIVCAMDYIGNRFVSSDVNMPFHFNTVSGWEKEFAKHSLKIERSNRLKILRFYPIKHHVFCMTL